MNEPVWDDAPWAPLPSLEGDVQADVCVVGLGGTGLSCILELIDRGLSVVGVDASTVGGGAAGRNGGILRPGVAAYHHEAVRALGRERALRLYELTRREIDRVAGTPAAGVRRTGMVRIGAGAADLADCDAQLAAMRADGLDATPHDGALGRGLQMAESATFQPLARCRALALDAVARGARLFERSRVADPVSLRSATGRVRCERTIIAVDGGLESLVPGLAPGVRTARLQMLATAPVADVVLPCPVAWNFGFDYAQQLPDGRVALGGGRDVAMEPEWTDDAEPTRDVQAYLERVLRERLDVSAPVTHRWAASVSYSSTGLPVLREVGPRTWAVGAFSGTGNLLGALAGRAAAVQACGGASELASLLAP